MSTTYIIDGVEMNRDGFNITSRLDPEHPVAHAQRQRQPFGHDSMWRYADRFDGEDKLHVAWFEDDEKAVSEYMVFRVKRYFNKGRGVARESTDSLALRRLSKLLEVNKMTPDEQARLSEYDLEYLLGKREGWEELQTYLKKNGVRDGA